MKDVGRILKDIRHAATPDRRAHHWRAAVWLTRRLRAADEGRAIVEFIFLGVLLLVPLTYLVLTAAQIQAGAFSASLAGREAARAFVSASDDGTAHALAQSAARIAFEDFGFPGDGALTISCDGTPCLRPDGTVTATATVSVRLPLLPELLDDVVPTSVTLSSTHVHTVDRFVSR